MKMKIKIKHRKQGVHHYATIFMAKKWNETFCNCGNLVMRESEWNAFRASMRFGAAVPTDLKIEEQESK